MKKLCFMLVAAMAANAVFAAVSVKWNSGEVNQPSGSGLLGDETTMYVWYFGTDSTVYDSIMADWAKDETGKNMTALVWKQYGKSLDSASASTEFADGEAQIQQTTGLTKNQPAYAAIIMTHEGDDGVDYYMGNVAMVDSVPSGGATMYDLGLLVGGGDGDVATAWISTASPVPEPFSGSLAVLGMGLLALRRKMKKQKKA